MHCLSCGTQMRFVRVVPYQVMIKTRELHLFECPICKRTERRLVSAYNIGSLSGEPMQLASESSPLLAPAMERISAAARNGWMCVVGTWRDAISSARVRMTSIQQVPVVFRSVWQRTCATLGSLSKRTS